MASVSFENVGKVYEDGTRALRAFDLDVRDGEFVVLVGPSGCGKTTALRLVAGLEEITEGEIRIGDRVINHLDARARDVAMVFQNYALYPHFDVYRNIGFGLEVRKVPRKEIRRRVQEITRVLGIADLLKRKPRQLSGGQRQRVAMGRAIVRYPQAFLMDEPLSNLDAKLRVQMRAEISRIQRELNATTIYVTHDQVEAMTMGERVAVLRQGELQQTGVPQKIYDEPANLFVASFIGSPAMNIIEGELAERDGGLVCTIGDQELALEEKVLRERPALRSYRKRPVAVGIRPEHLGAAAERRNGEGQRLRGKVLLTEALGPELLAHVEIAGRPVTRDEVLEAAVDFDAAAVAGLRDEARERRTTLVGRFDSGSHFDAGETIEIAVDTEKIHFFDLETGNSVPLESPSRG